MLNPERNEDKRQLSPQEINNFRSLLNETFVIADHEYVKIFCFAVLDVKL